MINKFYKIIHTKYYRFIKFIFFLRYLFAIFLISIALFLTIPNFLNYERKVGVLKNHVFKNYNLKIHKYEKIKFQAFPFPSLEFKDVEINLASSSIKLNVKTLKLFPKILSIYNFENYQSKKLILKNNNIILETTDLKFLIKNLFNQKNKLFLDNLKLQINDKNKPIFKLKNIKFANYGYNKNLIKGEIFGKKFKSKVRNNFKNINFKLIDSGISANINFDESKIKDQVKGVFKSKVLNTNLKFKFNYKDKKLTIFNSYFRSKDLSFRNNNVIIFDPFIDLNSKFQIEEINTQILKMIDLQKLLKSKDMIKRLNSKNVITFKSKKFSRNLIEDLNLKIDLAYGRMNYFKKFSISQTKFQCKGNINLSEEFPLLFFDCSINLNNKKKFLKKFSLETSSNNEDFKIFFSGNLNILNNTINFINISLNKNYKATKEDLNFFKESFELILLKRGFFEMFNTKKIREFILEVS